MYQASDARYSSMPYHRCGKSGLLLPAVSLGFWHNFGDTGHYETMKQLCFTAFDHGITHFDLANNYGPEPGSAEKNLGRILHENFMPYRDELIISTKAGYTMWDGPYGDWGSRKYLLASLEGRLPWMNKFVMFLLMAVAMTGIEYIAGLLCLKVAKVRLWDYSYQWGNIQGIICPLFSLYWAVGGALYYFLIHPHILGALDWLSRNLAFSFVIGMYFGVFLLDFAHSANLVAKLRAFANEYDVVVRYEALKLHIRQAEDAAKHKYHFFRPFYSELPLREHLKQMADGLEKRKIKKAK